MSPSLAMRLVNSAALSEPFDKPMRTRISHVEKKCIASLHSSRTEMRDRLRGAPQRGFVDDIVRITQRNHVKLVS